MHKIKEYQERKRQMFRFRSLKSIFSSLILTTAVVSAIVITIPNSADAEIVKLNAFENAVAYTLNVTDEDSSIISGTLKVDLKSDFKNRETLIEPGKSIGSFTDLKPDTEYTLNITADKGYGPEILDSKTFVTTSKTGGAITGIHLLSDENAEELGYNISYYISDESNEYHYFKLIYAYKMQGEDSFQNYQEISIDKNQANVEILNIYNYNSEINIILQATNYNDEVVELDNQTFMTPFKVLGYIDLQQLTSNSVSLMIGTDYYFDDVSSYELLIYKNDRVIRKESLRAYDDLNQNQDFFENNRIVTIDFLYPESTYRAELRAKYINPYTLLPENKAIATLEFTTLKNFKDKIDITEFSTYYEVNITLSEDDDVFDQGYYMIYDNSVSNEYPIDNEYFYYQYENGSKKISFTIDKPSIDNYKIEIGISSSNNYFYYEILKTIESD